MRIALIMVIASIYLSSCGSNMISGNNEHSKKLVKSYNNIPNYYKDTEGFNSCISSNINYCFEQEVNNRAIESRDSIHCSDLKNSVLQEQCTDTILSLLARDSNSLENCNAIKGVEKANCRYAIISKEAREKGDVNICDKITVDGETSESMNTLYKNVVNNCKNGLYITEAFSNLDEEICNKISDRDTKVSCLKQITIAKGSSAQNNQAVTEGNLSGSGS